MPDTFYDLNGYDLTLGELVNLMHDNGYTDFNEFLPHREECIEKYLEEIYNGK